MSKYKYSRWSGVLAIMLFSGTACQKDYLNPSTISETQAISSVDGLAGLCNGLQYRYAVGRQSPLYESFGASGLSSLELRVINSGNTDEAALETGGAGVVNTNAIVSQLWTQSLLLLKESNKVLDNLGVATDPGVKSGLQAFASIYKALALGTLATFFQQAPITIGDNQPFVDRKAVLQAAVSVLETAEASVSANAISSVIAGKLASGMDIKNTVYALQARYNNMLGDYVKSVAAANKVDPKAKSAFKYDAVNTNPIAFVSFQSNNVVQPKDFSLGLGATLVAETGDKRLLGFYITDTTGQKFKDARGANFGTLLTSSIPVYTYGEIILIRAEADAQTSKLTDAVTEINSVRQKKASADTWGIGANLGAYTGGADQASILAEIYRQRSFELAYSGLRLEDSRRLGRPAPKDGKPERNRNYYPYPAIERNNNTATPTDPDL